MLEVVVGTNCVDGGKRYAVEKYIIHPKYDSNVLAHGSDIALVKLKDDIEFNDEVQPIPYSSDEFTEDVEALVVGWNRFIVSHSLFVCQYIFQFSECKMETKASIFLIFKNLEASMYTYEQSESTSHGTMQSNFVECNNRSHSYLQF